MNALEEEVECLVGGAGILVAKSDEDVYGVHAQAISSSLVLAPDGCDNVAREVQGSRGCMGGRGDGMCWGRTLRVQML